MLPYSNVLPSTCRDLHAIMKDIGMKYQAIHAFYNDHILYHGEHVLKEECPNCQISIY